MNRIFSLLTLLLSFFPVILTPPPATATQDEDLTFKEYLNQANNYIKSYRHFEASDALKQATKLGGAKHPSLHMRLGILYYGLGLIPEAITQGEKAVALAPSSKWYKYDLAKFYYVDKQFDKAEKQFVTLLKLDPGFTLAYYYLAELYFQKQDYDLAWLCMQRAQLLGHRGRHLIEKLESLSSKPRENFSQSTNSTLFRFIKISSEEQAHAILQEIQKGKLFENLELELKKDNQNSADFGIMHPSELNQKIADLLAGSKPYSVPEIIQTGMDFRIMQRIVSFDPETLRNQNSQSSKINSNKTAVAASSSGIQSATVAAASKDKAPMEAAPSNTFNEIKNKSAKLAALQLLHDWKSSWSNQDLDGYLSTYSDSFIPTGGKSLASWKKKRKRSLARPAFITVSVENPEVELVTEKQQIITFHQEYTSNTYKDTVIKTLTLEKEDAGWKIIRERVVNKH